MSKYKLHSEIRRVPLGALRVNRERRPYLTDEEFARLLDGEVFIEEKLDGHPEVLESSELVFYCEDLRWKHSIYYDAVPMPGSTADQAPPFWVCYDIWIPKEERWASREEKGVFCEVQGLPVPPLVHVGEITADMIPDLAARQSAFGPDQAEGIVIKNYRRGLFGKFINSEFREKLEDAENWRRLPRVANRLDTQHGPRRS